MLVVVDTKISRQYSAKLVKGLIDMLIIKLYISCLTPSISIMLYVPDTISVK